METAGEWERSTQHYEEALKLYDDSINRQTIAWIYEGLGLNEKDLGNFKEAGDFFLKSIEILEIIGDSSSLSNVYYNFAILKYRTKNYREALKYSDLSH